MLKSSLRDYIDAYILRKNKTKNKGRIKITGAGDDVAARQTDERNKDVIFKNCAPIH